MGIFEDQRDVTRLKDYLKIYQVVFLNLVAERRSLNAADRANKVHNVYYLHCADIIFSSLFDRLESGVAVC